MVREVSLPQPRYLATPIMDRHTKSTKVGSASTFSSTSRIPIASSSKHSASSLSVSRKRNVLSERNDENLPPSTHNPRSQSRLPLKASKPTIVARVASPASSVSSRAAFNLNEDETQLLNMREPEMFGLSSPVSSDAGWQRSQVNKSGRGVMGAGRMMTPANSQEGILSQHSAPSTVRPLSRLPTPPSSQSNEAGEHSTTLKKSRPRPAPTPPRRSSHALASISSIDPSPNPRRKKSPRVEELAQASPIRVRGQSSTPRPAPIATQAKSAKGKGRASIAALPTTPIYARQSSQAIIERIIPATAPTRKPRHSSAPLKVAPKTVAKARAKPRKSRTVTPGTARGLRKSLGPAELFNITGKKVGVLDTALSSDPEDDPLLLRAADDDAYWERVARAQKRKAGRKSEIPKRSKEMGEPERVRARSHSLVNRPTSFTAPEQTSIPVVPTAIVPAKATPVEWQQIVYPSLAPVFDNNSVVPAGVDHPMEAMEGQAENDYYDPTPAWASDDGSDADDLPEAETTFGGDVDDTFIHVLARKNEAGPSQLRAQSPSVDPQEVQHHSPGFDVPGPSSPVALSVGQPDMADVQIGEPSGDEEGDTTHEALSGEWDVSTSSNSVHNVSRASEADTTLEAATGDWNTSTSSSPEDNDLEDTIARIALEVESGEPEGLPSTDAEQQYHAVPPAVVPADLKGKEPESSTSTDGGAHIDLHAEVADLRLCAVGGEWEVSNLSYASGKEGPHAEDADVTADAETGEWDTTAESLGPGTMFDSLPIHDLDVAPANIENSQPDMAEELPIECESYEALGVYGNYSVASSPVREDDTILSTLSNRYVPTPPRRFSLRNSINSKANDISSPVRPLSPIVQTVRPDSPIETDEGDVTQEAHSGEWDISIESPVVLEDHESLDEGLMIPHDGDIDFHRDNSPAIVSEDLPHQYLRNSDIEKDEAITGSPENALEIASNRESTPPSSVEQAGVGPVASVIDYDSASAVLVLRSSFLPTPKPVFRLLQLAEEVVVSAEAPARVQISTSVSETYGEEQGTAFSNDAPSMDISELIHDDLLADKTSDQTLEGEASNWNASEDESVDPLFGQREETLPEQMPMENPSLGEEVEETDEEVEQVEQVEQVEKGDEDEQDFDKEVKALHDVVVEPEQSFLSTEDALSDCGETPFEDSIDELIVPVANGNVEEVTSGVILGSPEVSMEEEELELVVSESESAHHGADDDVVHAEQDRTEAAAPTTTPQPLLLQIAPGESEHQLTSTPPAETLPVTEAVSGLFPASEEDEHINNIAAPAVEPANVRATENADELQAREVAAPQLKKSSRITLKVVPRGTIKLEACLGDSTDVGIEDSGSDDGEEEHGSDNSARPANQDIPEEEATPLGALQLEGDLSQTPPQIAELAPSASLPSDESAQRPYPTSAESEQDALISADPTCYSAPPALNAPAATRDVPPTGASQDPFASHTRSSPVHRFANNDSSSGISALEAMLHRRQSFSSALSGSLRAPYSLSKQVTGSTSVTEISKTTHPAQSPNVTHASAASTRSLGEEIASATATEHEGDESFKSVVEVSSLDPRAAARAAAILKLNHKYIEHGVWPTTPSSTTTSLPPTTSPAKTPRRHARSKSAFESEHFSTIESARKLNRDELLYEAELEIVASRRSKSRERSHSRARSLGGRREVDEAGWESDETELALPGGWKVTPGKRKRRNPPAALPPSGLGLSTGPSEIASDEDGDGKGKGKGKDVDRPWGVSEWKRLEKIYRLEKEAWIKEREVKPLPTSGLFGWAKRAFSGTTPTPTEWSVDRVVERFIDEEKCGTWGGEWARKMIALRVVALEKRVNRHPKEPRPSGSDEKEAKKARTVLANPTRGIVTPMKQVPSGGDEGDSTVISIVPPTTIRRMLGSFWSAKSTRPERIHEDEDITEVSEKDAGEEEAPKRVENKLLTRLKEAQGADMGGAKANNGGAEQAKEKEQAPEVSETPMKQIGTAEPAIATRWLPEVAASMSVAHPSSPRWTAPTPTASNTSLLSTSKPSSIPVPTRTARPAVPSTNAEATPYKSLYPPLNPPYTQRSTAIRALFDASSAPTPSASTSASTRAIPAKSDSGRNSPSVLDLVRSFEGDSVLAKSLERKERDGELRRVQSRGG